jgi:DNA (cytosine-5)-methyltransferase 1
MAYARIIGELRPDIFVMENVPRAAKSRNFAEMLDLIQGWGYSEFKRVLHVQDYGVPQDRSRFIVIGYKDKILDGIDGEFGPHSHLPPVLPSACLPDLDRYYRHPTTYKRRAIFATGELAPTVRGLNRPMPATYRQHPNDACKTLAGVRALTSMERARLQTFPDGFAFANPLSKGHNDQMVGNAVPSKFAEAIGRAVLNALKRNGRMAVPQGTSADLLEPAL